MSKEKLLEILKNQEAALQAMVNRSNALAGHIKDTQEQIAKSKAQINQLELAVQTTSA